MSDEIQHEWTLTFRFRGSRESFDVDDTEPLGSLLAMKPGIKALEEFIDGRMAGFSFERSRRP